MGGVCRRWSASDGPGTAQELGDHDHCRVRADGVRRERKQANQGVRPPWSSA